jgi:hypothetical protein
MSASYRITIQGYDNASFTNVNFTITDPNGNVIPCTEYDTSNNSNDQAAMAAQRVPLLELNTDTIYTVKVMGNMSNASVASTPFTLTWSFTTGATNAIQDQVAIFPDLLTRPIQPIDGLSATNQAILTAQYNCEQTLGVGSNGTNDCNWLANPLVAAGNQSGTTAAAASTTLTASN